MINQKIQIMFIQDNILKITYASSATEEDIQKLIVDIKLNLSPKIDTIQIDNEDMPISLLFFLVELLKNDNLNLTLNSILFNRLQNILDAEIFQNQVRIIHE